MSKEYHVFTNVQTNHEQAFIFEVDRNHSNHTVELKELWIITTQNNGEVKTRIHMDHMINSILDTEGGNIIDDTVDNILGVFEDVLGPEKVKEVRSEMESKLINKKTADELIQASEFADMLYQNKDIQSIVDELLNKQSNGNNEQ